MTLPKLSSFEKTASKINYYAYSVFLILILKYLMTRLLISDCNCSHEAVRDPREAGSDPDTRPELVRAAVVCHDRRRSLRGPHVAYVQPQVMRRDLIPTRVRRRGWVSSTPLHPFLHTALFHPVGGRGAATTSPSGDYFFQMNTKYI